MWTKDLRPGDGVIVDHGGPHPGVVLLVEASFVVVIQGSSKARPHMDEVCIEPRTAAGTMLGLSMPTYFNASRIVTITEAEKIVRKMPKRCPLNVFQQLASLLETKL